MDAIVEELLCLSIMGAKPDLGVPDNQVSDRPLSGANRVHVRPSGACGAHQVPTIRHLRPFRPAPSVGKDNGYMR
jgi:hypothetical protein